MAKYTQWITKEGLTKIEGWARDGLTDEQIAENMGIAVSTLNAWKNKFSEFSESLKKGKEVVDRQVESALLKNALGYEYEEVTYETVEDEMTGGYKEIPTKRVVKQQKPDTTAQIFWLKNRKPEEWRDKHVTEHEGSIDVNERAEAIKNRIAELRKSDSS